jgi:hypothetical protein
MTAIGASRHSSNVQVPQALIPRSLPKLDFRCPFIRLKLDFDRDPRVLSHGVRSRPKSTIVLYD